MSFSLPSVVTFWTIIGNDGTGGKTWSAPTQTAARVASVNTVSFDSNGKEFNATKSIYTREALPVNSYVVIGDTNDLEPTQGAQMVRSLASNSSFTNMFKSMV